MAELLIAGTIGSIGLNVVAQCITSLTASANGIYTLVGNITNNGSVPDIANFFEESDIKGDIQVLEFLIKEINPNNNPTKTLAKSLHLLKECVSEIEEKLKEVKRRVDYNNSLWFFTSIRSYGFTDMVRNLKSLKQKLNGRRDGLFEILKINNYLTPLSESKYMDMNQSKVFQNI
ncbi:MAG: hypothetical protein EBQ92_01290 [Proteobacteria bacterium]|nr:hypothetical protein [Pseudomonadota bacterium]